MQTDTMTNPENSSTVNDSAQPEPESHQEPKSSKLKSVWRLSVFPRLLMLSIYQFSVYLNKLYQDCSAVATYYEQQQPNFFMVSAASLILPVFMYSIFQMTSYLSTRSESTDLEELGTKTVNGLLLVPWQIKRHLDKLYFVSQHVCSCRSLSDGEDLELLELERQAMVLEFFEDFFAGLLQILLQMYIFITSFQYKHQPIIGVIVGSVLSILQMLMAVRRKDDGVLTSILSFVGWILIAVSRAIALSLVASVVHFWVILLILGHAFVITLWVTSIAVRSYQGSSSETSNITKRKGISLFIVVFILFGLPSLMYWPFMFELKERKRPLIFLTFTLIENVGLFAFWYFFRPETIWSTMNITLTCVLFGSCIFGILMLLLYLCVKPRKTDLVVLYNVKKLNENSYGIYYDFFEAVFQLPSTEAIGSDLEEAQKMFLRGTRQN